MSFKVAEPRHAQSRRSKPRNLAPAPRGGARRAPPPMICLQQLKAAMVAILKERYGDDILQRAPRVMVGATCIEESGRCDLFDIDVDELIAKSAGQE